MIIPKGGFQKIKQESEAVLQDTWYILPIDDKTAKIIVVDKCGKKRVIGSASTKAGGDYIPLTGTEEDKYLTGDIEIKSINNNGKPVGFKSEFVPVNGIRYSQNFGLQSSSNYMQLDWEFKNDLNPSASWLKSMRLDKDGIRYDWINENISEYHLVQKDYVDKAVQNINNTYSPIEKQIGWHEYYENSVLVKKPLYRRVFEFTTITGGQETVATGLNTLNVINIKGTTKDGDVIYKLGTRVAFGAGVDDYIIQNYDAVISSINNLVVVTKWIRPANSSGNVIQNIPGIKYNIILEYTKTTDSATEVNP